MIRLLFFLLLLPLAASAQVDSPKHKSKPLDLPVSFSGNYGELRDGRFHAGLDFRVGGRVGDKIFSIDEGYIYRVSVSPVGYGNGIYIVHPDGTTSVYGHLSTFTPEIEKVVKAKQYAEKRFAVTLFFAPEEFPVSAGQYIGNVGNSGSSAAPHLHLEVRDSSGNGPLNPIAEGYFDIKDDVPPIIRSVNFYSIEDSTGAPMISLRGSFQQKTSQVILLGDKSYVAVDADDKQYGTVANLSVEKYEVFFDDDSLFCFKLGNYSYKEQDCFNSLIDYGEKISSGVSMVKSYVEPGNGFYPSKISCRDKGLIVLKDNEIHTVKVRVSDMFGNRAERNFKVQRGEAMPLHEVRNVNETHLHSTFIPWFAPYAYAGDGLRVSFPVKSLFSSAVVTVDSLQASDFGGALPELYSKIWKIGDSRTAMKKAGRIGIAASLPEGREDKGVIVSISQDGKISNCGGRYYDGKMVGRFFSFGTFAVAVDTVAPTIVPRFQSTATIARSGQAAFTVKDDLSGIDTYNAAIDGEWVIARYDLKYDKMWIVLDTEVVKRGGEHTLILTVTDKKENSTTYNCKFKW